MLLDLCLCICVFCLFVQLYMCDQLGYNKVQSTRYVYIYEYCIFYLFQSLEFLNQFFGETEQRDTQWLIRGAEQLGLAGQNNTPAQSPRSPNKPGLEEYIELFAQIQFSIGTNSICTGDLQKNNKPAVQKTNFTRYKARNHRK